MKSLSEIKHCDKCKPHAAGNYMLAYFMGSNKRLPNPYCRDASCACHQVRRNKEKKNG